MGTGSMEVGMGIATLSGVGTACRSGVHGGRGGSSRERPGGEAYHDRHCAQLSALIPLFRNLCTRVGVVAAAGGK